MILGCRFLLSAFLFLADRRLYGLIATVVVVIVVAGVAGAAALTAASKKAAAGNAASQSVGPQPPTAGNLVQYTPTISDWRCVFRLLQIKNVMFCAYSSIFCAVVYLPSP